MAYWCHQVLRRDRQRDKCPSEWDHAGLWPEPVQRRDSGHLNSTQKQGRRHTLNTWKKNQDMVAKVDMDGSGLLNFPEFLAMMGYKVYDVD